MKASCTWLIAIGAAVTGAGAGFWFGVRAGANVVLMIDSAPRAVISVQHLKAIDAGKTTNTVIGLESDVDTALLWNHTLEEHVLYPFLEPVWGFPVHTTREYLTRLADYRKEHPSPLRPEVLGMPKPESEKDREFQAWLNEGARDNQKIISQMVSRYATKPANSQ